MMELSFVSFYLIKEKNVNTFVFHLSMTVVIVTDTLCLAFLPRQCFVYFHTVKKKFNIYGKCVTRYQETLN